MLNKQKGNMYDWVTHTWNTIKGECPHGCHYCYMKKWGEQKPIRFTSSELKTDLGKNNLIFVGSSCDMWAEEIADLWISHTLSHCRKYQGNEYLFQTKDPYRFLSWVPLLPENTILGATIESDQFYKEMGQSPSPINRVKPLLKLKRQGFKIMITIEPVMDFYLSGFVDIIKSIKPDWVNIGANTNTKVKLKEPNADKLLKFIEQISEFTEIKKKSNLSRLLKTN